jgi:hypothetical protein
MVASRNTASWCYIRFKKFKQLDIEDVLCFDPNELHQCISHQRSKSTYPRLFDTQYHYQRVRIWKYFSRRVCHGVSHDRISAEGVDKVKTHDLAKKGILTTKYVGKTGWMTAACICSPYCMYSICRLF